MNIKRVHSAILILGVVSTCIGTAIAADKDTEAINKAVVRSGFQSWSDGTGSPYDLLAPDAKWTIVGRAPVSRTYQTKQEFIDAVISPFNARMKRRLIPTMRGMYAEGDMVVVLFDAEGVALDGKPYRNTYSWYMRIRKKKAVEVTAFFDTIEFTDLWSRIVPK